MQDLLESQMHSVFLKLNGVVDDDLQPFLTDIEFCDGIILDDLPDEVVGSVEHRLQRLVLSL